MQVLTQPTLSRSALGSGAARLRASMAATPPGGSSYGTGPGRFLQKLRSQPPPSRRPLYVDLGIVGCGLCLLIPIVFFVRNAGTAKMAAWSVVVVSALVVATRVAVRVLAGRRSGLVSQSEVAGLAYSAVPQDGDGGYDDDGGLSDDLGRSNAARSENENGDDDEATYMATI